MVEKLTDYKSSSYRRKQRFLTCVVFKLRLIYRRDKTTMNLNKARENKNKKLQLYMYIVFVLPQRALEVFSEPP